MSLSKEDLLASLSLGSDSAPTFEDTIGIEMSLEDLEKQCALLGPADTAGPTRAARPVRNPQRPSINGRPEETNVRKTIIHQNTKTKQGKIIQIGNWQLGERLGKGAFGTVYKGLDLRTGQFVAVKRIVKGAVDGRTMMKEINFLKTFNHPNIVSYVNLIQTEGHLNLILEYVDSGSLAQVLAGYGFFPESLAAIYTEQVLQGLDYLHKRSVIHRDIKGGNILITREGAIKLADFGIATVASPNPRHSLVEGSPYWMAPEAIEMSCNPTTKSDIWSLGCTLIELITGVPPYFEMVSVSACYRMVNDDHPPLPDDISKELADFLLKCFTRNVDERPDAEALLSHPWIRKHVHTSKPDADQMKRTIKRHTMGKESQKLRTDLANLDFDAETFEEALNSSSNSSTPRVQISTQRASVQQGSTKPAKSTPAKEKPPITLTIYSVETRRSIFTYTVYHMKIVNGNKTYEIERTWSDFKEMHDQVQIALPTITLPACPERRFWGVMDPDFVRRRWKEMQQCANEMLAISRVRENDAFKSFLENKK